MTRTLRLAALALALTGRAATAQDTLSVERLQEAALRSDPRADQRALLRTASDVNLKLIAADRLPQLELNGQATHQSDVTRPTFGIPGVTLPDFPKERWQTTLDVEQRLYDGGEVARRVELEEARHAESQAALDVSLYQLRSDVNSAFYAALLYQKLVAEYEALVVDLDARLTAVRARVEAGTALGRDAAEIEAEWVRAGLQRDEARGARRASLAILTDLVGSPVDTSDVLVLPSTEPERTYPADLATVSALRRHPEFDQLRRSRERLGREIAYTATENRPRLFAFGQAGVGLPGLDQFRQSSDAFYQVGLRVRGPGTPRAAWRRPTGSSRISSPPKSGRWAASWRGPWSLTWRTSTDSRRRWRTMSASSACAPRWSARRGRNSTRAPSPLPSTSRRAPTCSRRG
jgi:outer membrane protein TolC